MQIVTLILCWHSAVDYPSLKISCFFRNVVIHQIWTLHLDAFKTTRCFACGDGIYFCRWFISWHAFLPYCYNHSIIVHDSTTTSTTSTATPRPRQLTCVGRCPRRHHNNYHTYVVRRSGPCWLGTRQTARMRYTLHSLSQTRPFTKTHNHRLPFYCLDLVLDRRSEVHRQ